MNIFIKISTFLLVCLITLSCSSDKNKEEDCLSENFKTSFKIRLDVDTHMTDYKDICLDNDNEPETRSAEAWRLRYTVCAYSENGPSDVPVASLSSLSPVIDLTLPLGKYNIIAWADYISDESLNSQYFHTDDFTDILLRDKFSYSGDDTHKIGFIGNENLTVSTELRNLIYTCLRQWLNTKLPLWILRTTMYQKLLYHTPKDFLLH